MGNNLFNTKWLERLFERHFENLTGFVYNYVKDEDTVKDIVHDAFLSLWNNRNKLDESKSVKSYLFTIAQNHALNYLRHLKVECNNKESLSETLQRYAEDEFESYEKQLSRLEIKFKELPAKQREVIEKCIMEGKKYKEAAMELGISTNTVKTHITRALRSLRNELENKIVLFLFHTYKNLSLSFFRYDAASCGNLKTRIGLTKNNLQHLR